MTLLDPSDALERQNEKLVQIAASLMRRVEQQTDQSGLAYAQFERAALLEDQVRARTRDLESALGLLHDSNAKLEAARANLADAIESVSEGFALFDSREELVLCNSHFCEGFRDIAGHLVPGLAFGKYVDLVSRSSYLQLPPGETPAGWAKTRKSRHERRNSLFNVQLRNDRWLQVSERMTPGRGTVVLQTDVTDIVRLEREELERLKDRQSRQIAATLAHLAQGVCIFDDRQRLLVWNPRAAELLRVPANRISIGAPFSKLIERLPREFKISKGISWRGLREWTERTKNRQSIRFELTAGKLLTLDAFAQALPDGGFVISVADVTAEREAANRLRALNEELEARVAERTAELESAVSAAERANASKSRFVAAASHDLLQPLSAARLFVGALRGAQTGPDQESTLDKAATALHSVERIIEALLDISRLDSGRAVFERRAVPLNQIFAPLKNELDPVAREKGLDLRVTRTSLVVNSDSDYLRRIVQNLAANAVRYTARGKVLMGARRRGNHVRIGVWDTGPGIPDRHRREIFREFSRLDLPASASEGLGLGLAIVERACVGLGHNLELRSQPGRGTAFFVDAPVARPEGAENLPMREDCTLGKPGAGNLVFLVENDREFGHAMALTLEGFGADVIEAENAHEALELLGELGLKPDGFIIDQQLGSGQVGTELYAVIKRLYGPIPARIVSALRGAELERHCRDIGAPLLNKPLAPEDLARFLAELPRA